MSSRRLLRSAVVAASALAYARAAHGTTIPGGVLVTQIWSPAGNPYIVQGDVTVPAGATLTIQAGTIVQFPSGDIQGAGLDVSRTEMTINGALAVQGTDASPVVFAAQSGDAAGTWYGIVGGAAATSVAIAGAQIANAYDAIHSAAPGATLSVTKTTLRKSTNSGVYLSAGSPTLDGITVTGNAYGVWVAGGAPTLQNSAVFGNSNTAVYVTGGGTITLLGNTIYGTSDVNVVSGSVSVPLRPAGDVSGNGVLDVADVFYLINYLFAGGPAPQ